MGLKNSRAEKMTILLRDANKSVNSNYWHFPPVNCEQQPERIHPLRLECSLGGAFLRPCHNQGFGVSETNESGWMLRMWPLRERVSPKDLVLGPQL